MHCGARSTFLYTSWRIKILHSKNKCSSKQNKGEYPVEWTSRNCISLVKKVFCLGDVSKAHLGVGRVYINNTLILTLWSISVWIKHEPQFKQLSSEEEERSPAWEELHLLRMKLQTTGKLSLPNPASPSLFTIPLSCRLFMLTSVEVDHKGALFSLFLQVAQSSKVSHLKPFINEGACWLDAFSFCSFLYLSFFLPFFHFHSILGFLLSPTEITGSGKTHTHRGVNGKVL